MARSNRLLFDSILIAAHRACDERRLRLARQLLRLSEAIAITESDPRRRQQAMWTLVAAHERVWHLRQDEPTQDG